MTFKVWGKDDVYLRFIEAAETFRRLPPVKLPKAFGNAMPDVVHDLADANRQEPERDKGEWNWKPARIPPKADAITRAEQVLDWSVKYLAKQSGMRRCLWGQVMCAVHHRSFARYCRNRGWSRATAYRRIDQGLQFVADCLNNDHVPYTSADVDQLEQVRQISIPTTL